MPIGVLHPGAMGASIGAALVGGGHSTLWASTGRSRATRARADHDGLVDVGSLDELVAQAHTIISVCPPGEATTVATQVAGLDFGGVYVDANAVAPATARAIADVVSTAGATYLDGGIVGLPASDPDRPATDGPDHTNVRSSARQFDGFTVLYLSGDADRSHKFASLFADSSLQTYYVGDGAGAASALKMAFAAWTKGTSALLLAIRALAENEGVVDGLDHAWSVLTPDLIERLPATALGTAPKAWRFVDEMHEIAATFEAAGLPSGFHEAAATVYEALADLRDRTDVDVDNIVRRLTSD